MITKYIFVTGATFNGSSGVLTLKDNANQESNISGLTNIELVQSVETINVEGTNTGTTSVLIYGINLVTASTVSDFCTRLPLTPQKGKSVTVINTSDYKVRVFPSVNGGKINNVTDGFFDVPNDGLPYVFVCYENPNPGYWGTTNRPSSNLSTIVIPDMSINHTGSTANYVGVGTPIQSSFGSGIDGNDNLTLTPSSTYWRSENMVATATMLRVYTNILTTDVSGATITVGIGGAHKTDVSSSTSGTRGSVTVSDYCEFNPSIQEYCSTVVGGVLNTPAEIGDVGTMYFEFPVINGTQIGLGGTTNPYSRYYYTFSINIQSGVVPKIYKFRFELDYV